MGTPSTGNFRAPENKKRETSADHPGRASQTRTSVKGEPSPRLPHERDESSDSAGRDPDSTMKMAHADAVSEKVATDKSEEMNLAYGRLRDRLPGEEPDRPK